MNDTLKSAPPVDILIVEDSPTQAQRLRFILEQAGYRVAAMADGRQAIEAARRRKPSLIISDINMPVMDGFELCGRIKADANLADVPVILSTTLLDSQYLVRCLECSADNFIAKPFEPDYLLERVRHVLRNGRRSPTWEASPAVEITIEDQPYRITASREQILNLLFSSYAAAEQRNKELLQAKEHLIAAREAADSSNQAKSQFLATMSHELRTPLNGILGMNELLLQTELDHRQRRFVEACSTSGKALLQQINDVLDLSKIEAGKLELDVRPCNLESLVVDCAEVFAHAAAQKGLTFDCQVDPSACLTVLADETRVRQILINLLGNAVKFTAAGRVAVFAEAAQRLEGPRTIRLSVTDTGLGISKEGQSRLFSPFSQVDSSTTRRFGGTGLGLSVCKQLVELMDGQIGVDSQPGKGSTFWFEMPLAIVADPQMHDDHRGDLCRAEACFSGHVLVAEDNAINKLYIVELLKYLGCSSDLAVNGKEAVEAVARKRYDLVLMDCQMPEMDGFAASREIRKLEAAGECPARTAIVALTANALQGDRQRCLEAGMDDYVTKPVEGIRLKAVLEKFLSHNPTSADAAVN